MNKSIKKELRFDAASLYKQSMQSLYMKWCKKFDASEIRLEYLCFVQDYVMSKTKDALRHRVKNHAKRRIKRLLKKSNLDAVNLEPNLEQINNKDEDIFSEILK
jgi:hypothetical protein